MRNAAKSRERNGQMRPLRTCIRRKTLETQKPVQDYHCTPDIGCLHDADRLKAAAITVNNRLLTLIYFASFLFELGLSNKN